jgi:hypothetical protein
MIALKARPSLHDDVKSLTLTLGYLVVVFCAHRSNASLAETSSCPTTMSEIWKKEKKELLYAGSHPKKLEKLFGVKINRSYLKVIPFCNTEK